ncbi:MAG: GNAT family N-acetyltransferase [Prevotellaceae bacterium]|jgi:diamine N-acetyltransferase|nr:GNAT family N-acetyltransferase [Prevotellaceae bacterium]
MLENDTVKLRALEPDDVNLLYLWENDPDVWLVGERVEPYSKFDIERYILSEGDIFANRQLRLMIERKHDGVAIGAVDLFDFNPLHRRAGIGLLIYQPENRGRGYAGEALKIIVNYAFSLLNIHVLYCNVSANNISSLHCMKKAGFTECGVKKEWNITPSGRVDEIMLQLICGNEKMQKM